MLNFPVIAHKEYANHFLKTVIFKIDFDENDLISSKPEEIFEIFRTEFPRQNQSEAKGIQISFTKDQTPILQPISDSTTGKVLEMKSQDGQQTLSINKSSLTLNISGSSYKSFTETKKKLQNLHQFFEICKIENIKRTAIRKINIFEFTNQGNPSSVLTLILNPGLLSDFSFFPKPEQIYHNINTICFQKENTKLNLIYGLNSPLGIEQQLCQTILDIDLFDVSTIQSKNVFNLAEEINSEIFNIFDWSITDFTRKILDGHA